jgi:hypothetical protein
MEILGLLDTLESMILDGFKIPMTGKTIINEAKVLHLMDKIRLVVEGGQDFAKKAIAGEQSKEPNKFNFQQNGPGLQRDDFPEAPNEDIQKQVDEVMQQAYQIAKEVRYGADKYADEVLSNLEATTMRITRTIQAGRQRLTTQEDSLAEKAASK